MKSKAKMAAENGGNGAESAIMQRNESYQYQ
jgi:hypothetical protein